MRSFFCNPGAVIGLTLLFFSCAAFAATSADEPTTIFSEMQMYAVYAFSAFVIVFAAGVYFVKARQDKRQAPLNEIFAEGKAVHSVGPETSVTDCVRLMAGGKIGALIVMDGARLIGIFTERDALNKVLARGLNPASTKVSKVMTRDPYCVGPTMTVGDAMALITKGHFRHLPIVDKGKVLAVVSSGDLTRWLVQDEMAKV
jgi:CBS domain-containing protein